MNQEQEGWVAEHMGLAQSLALQVWRTAPHALDLDDMRATAYYGLVMAADRWRTACAKHGHDPERLEYLKPFIVMRVYGALMDEIRRADFASRSLRARAKQLQEASQDRRLRDTELADRTGMSVAEVRHTLRGMAARPVSMEAEELDPHADTDVESSAFTSGVLTVVVDVIAGLAPDARAVLALHYFGGRQLQDVAKTMGITESRASQLHAHAVLTVHGAMLTAARQNEA